MPLPFCAYKKKVSFRSPEAASKERQELNRSYITLPISIETSLHVVIVVMSNIAEDPVDEAVASRKTVNC